MTTGPRPTPYPIVLQIDEFGTPKGLGESSSIYVTTVSAVTISATNYLGLGGLSGFPGGDLSSLQFKTGNTTFNGSPFLKYSPQLSGLLANAVSATRFLAADLSAITISATTYLNIPKTNLSSLLDVQYSSVSGGQALIYSSSINKWAPGYTIYKSDAVPLTSVGVNGDIYLQYTDDSINAAYLSSLFDTNINAVSNGQSLIWSSGYWIASSLPIAPGAITSIPSASPIWNAASAEGYDIQFGVYSPVTQFDVIGFSVGAQQITNFPPSLAGPILGAQVNLSSLKDTGTLLGAPNNSLIARSTTEPSGNWIATLSPILNSLSATTISATNWQGLPSATPTWNANKISNLPVNFSNLQPFDIFGINFLTTEVTNFAASTAASFLVAQADLSALRDVWNTQAVIGDVLIYTADGYWEPSNSISLVNVSATNLRGVNIFGTSASISNVSATTVSSTNLSAINARITGLSATTISSTNWQGLPSATPIWNAASANGYDIEFGIYGPVTPFDVIGFSFETPERITNFAPSLAGPILGAQVNLSSLKDTGTLLGAPNNSLIARSTTEPSGNWIATLDPILNSLSASSIFAVSADLSSVKLTRYVEPKSTAIISSSSITLNLNNSQVFEISAISNISSITIQNSSLRSNVVQEFTIIFSADGTQRTVTDWGSIKWSGGTGPILTSTNNKKDIFSFMSPDNGTNWYGFVRGQNF